METLVLITLLAAALLWLWITTLAVLCVTLDPELTKFQRIAQLAITLCLPFIGASFVLKCVSDQSPQVIARFYIPWPFNQLMTKQPFRSHGGGHNGEEMPGAHSQGAQSHGGDLGSQ